MATKVLGSVTRVGQLQFKANYGPEAGSRTAGLFPDVRSAQAVIEQGALSGRRGNWQRENRVDGVESYVLSVEV